MKEKAEKNFRLLMGMLKDGKLVKRKMLECGHYSWEHRPEATFMRIWTCTESWRNKWNT